MKIIIPASGVGQRFIDAGYKETKPLIQVTPEKRIIDYVIDIFDKDNDEFFIISGPTTFIAMNNYLKSTNLNYKHFLHNGDKEGPVGAVMALQAELHQYIDLLDNVIVSYCDFGMEWNYSDFLKYVEHTNCDGCIPCYTGNHPHLDIEENVYAACKKYDDSDRVYEVKEKYVSPDKSQESWSPGVYYFKSFSVMLDSFYSLTESKETLNDEYYVSLAYNHIIDQEILSYDYVDKFYQFGTPRDFEYIKEKINIKMNLDNPVCSIDNTIILSAGKSERFLNLGYSQPKPFIPLGDTDIITHISDTFKNVQTKFTYVASEAHEKFWKDYNVSYVKPNKIGAAYSYKSACSDIEGEVLIVPCDLLARHTENDFFDVRSEADAIIFTASPNDFAKENEESFAWVGGTDNVIADISIKERTPGNDMVLIGSFWVRDNKILLDAIQTIFDKEMKVNGEYYLDNAFKELHKTYNVQFIELTNYISFGTPQEYNENRYLF